MRRCSSCGQKLVRIRRSFWQRFLYSGIYKCRTCEKAQLEARSFVFQLSLHARCPHCGNERLKILASRDRIDKFYSNPISRVQFLFGGKLYHCFWCRLQFYDVRHLADPAASNLPQSGPPEDEEAPSEPDLNVHANVSGAAQPEDRKPGQ